MPFVDSDPGPVDTLPPAVKPGPDLNTVLGAAFREGNSVVSAISAMRNSGSFAPVPGYSSWPEIKDRPEYWEHAFEFAGSGSPAETAALKAKIDAENADKQTMAAAGGMGWVAGLAAGGLDPTMLLPGRIGLKVLREGPGMLRGAAEVAGAMAVQSGAQETALHATQETRTAGESVLAVGSATLLGAFLGAAVGVLSKDEHLALTGALNHARIEMENHAAGRATPVGFDVYHGSPYNFDKFDFSKIGTGEGAQAFGHGLYFAENTEVATGYRDKLSTGNFSDPNDVASTYLKSLSDRQTAIQSLRDNADNFAVSDAASPEVLRQAADLLEAGFVPKSPGAVYKVRIKADPEHFIDWDKSFEQQSEHVKDAIRSFPQWQNPVVRADIENGAPLGIKFKNGLLPRTFDPVVAAQVYREAGIPGIKYLDQSSRGTGEGSRNYVLFDDRLAAITHKNDEPIFGSTGNSVGLATSGGAAATDVRQVQPVSAFGVEKMAADAKTRLMNNPLTTARRANADLGEQVLITEENLRGETTTLGGGPSVETELRVNKFSTQVGIMKELDEQWKDLRFAGDKAPWFARFRDAMEWLGRPAELPSYEEFDRMVAEAWSKGGTHDIPQVQAAAQYILAKRGPWADRAEKALEGFQKLEPREGEAQYPHDWDKQKITANRPEFVNFLTGIFDGSQRVKQGIQGRVRAFNNALVSHETNIKKLTGQLERKKASLEEDETLRDEVSRINKFAFQRATALREGEFRNVGGVREPAPGKNIEKARGGVVFETKVRERGNELADRVSAHLAEVEALEDKLNAEHANAAEMRGKIEDEIGKWEGKSTQEAKGALKAREKYEAERAAAAAKGTAKPAGRLASADDAVDLAVKRILASDQELDVEALRGKAHETADHILSGPAGRIWNEGSASRGGMLGPSGDNLRGSEARRTINVSNAEAWPWINQSAEKVANRWFDTIMPDVLIAERFGDVEMKEPIQKIRDEHAARSDALPPGRKARDDLAKAKNQAEEDIVHMRDSMRGVLNIPATETNRRIVKIGGIARNFNVLTSMGASGLASLGDAAGTQMRFGMMTAFRDGFMPYFQSLVSGGEFNREALRQAKSLGIAVDWELAARHHALSGVMEEYHPSSRFERTLQSGADKMQLWNGLATWTDRIKTITSFVAAAEMKRAMDAMARGTMTKKQAMILGENNITPALAEKILAQYAEHAPDGQLPNMGAWTDQEAKRAFNGALAREANIGVVTPGIGDKPNWMSDPVLGVLGQFKSFTAAAHTRILIANLQRRDADVLSGLVGAVGLGMLSYAINGVTGGQPVSKNPGDWIKEGMSRSNMLGWFEEGNAFASKMTRGQLDAYRLTGSEHMLSKYAGRSALDQILGPTAGKIERLSTVTGSAASMDWKASDTHALRQLFFFQNLLWLRGVFNEVEAGANSAFGVPAQKTATKH